MTSQTPSTHQTWALMLLFCFIAVLSRIIPHPWDATPNLALTWVLAQTLSRRSALSLTLLAIILSDLALNLTQGHPAFGSWSLFTYSGWLAVCYFSSTQSNSQLWSQASGIISASFGFWLWTNFGAWLCSPAYPNTFSGLITCFALGLPFLQHALLGDTLWAGLLLTACRQTQNRTLLST